MKHPLSLKTPLPAAALRISALAARQGIGVLDEIELELLSDKPDLAPEDLLGQPMQVSCTLRDAAEGVGGCGKRFIGGLCMRFGQGRPLAARTGERLFAYSASVRPWLWYLTRTSDCRVFQDLTVPQIVEKVFADFPGADFEFKLVRSYRTRVYCVQYRESDFNFVARLLEDEGIWWYFEHTEGKHKLMLLDDVASASAVPGAEKLPFMGAAASSGNAPDVSHIDSWSFSREVQTGKVALQSYDFERPSTSLLANAAQVREHELADFEHFDYESESYLKPEGSQRAATRADELASRHERLAGSSNAQALASGHLFTLQRHPRADQNTQYLCLTTQISARAGALEAGDAGADWQCSFSAVPAAQAFRPRRQTPKPFVQGPQTAVVVGPAGEEIFTDKYGRVKLQFHWDRYGKKNEKSSCWVRVSSPWAGKSFGFVQLPRIGQEVVVSFLEGDPDQPLITGRVYNAEQMPPWELPANATQSGWLSRSSKGGVYANANAIRFEDKKGEEQLWLHAEKNQDIEVENDETHWVGHDRTKTVDHDETVHVKHDRTETVDHDETITVHHDRKERVDNDETISIGRDRTETVGADERITIGDNRTEQVGVNEKITIGANRTEAVGANETITIGANRSVTIGGNKAETIALAKALSIGLGYQTTVGAAMNTSVGLSMSEQVGLLKSVLVGQSYTVNVGASYTLKATDSIKLEVGKSVLTMKSDGTVTLNGKDINIGADATCTITGDKIQNN